jgi:flagellar motor switch protein FliG
VSAELLKQLRAQDAQRVGEEIARLGKVSAEEAERVLGEFRQATSSRASIGRGGPEFTRRLLTKAFGPEEGTRFLERIRPRQSDAGAERLQSIDPARLARFVKDEHPQTIALILTQMAPAQAASLLKALPPALAADAALRVGKLEQISPDVAGRIAQTIGARIDEVKGVRRDQYLGLRVIADLFNRMEPDISDRLLTDLAAKDEALADSIRHLLFVFEDLLLLDKKAIQEVLSRITDRKKLTLALKGTSEKLQQHVLQTMSQRGAEMLREDMEALGPVRIADVESAQQEVLATVRQLEKDGVISTRGGGDQYVE